MFALLHLFQRIFSNFEIGGLVVVLPMLIHSAVDVELHSVCISMIMTP